MSQADDLREVDFEAWKSDPVTVRFFEWVDSKMAGLTKRWAHGELTGPNWDQTMIQNVAATGAHSAYEEVSQVEFDDLQEIDK